MEIHIYVPEESTIDKQSNIISVLIDSEQFEKYNETTPDFPGCILLEIS
ncbi:hypothetical protein T4C_8257 [Trichinella pseudospiralis]|uniref:Uncharacterized protein n=1 Tax=Trichinella pseudospiralis TaxID=6337 RepID=A0A0V1JJR4_TRIPS|nr:hypothetical protein T4C_8257 [Trichinella pseudospiralis]